MTEIVPLGDRAFLARFGTEDQAARWASTLRQQGWPEVLDVVLAYHTVGIHADPDRVDLDELAGRLAGLEARPPREREGNMIRLPVYYAGVDLDDVARKLGLSEEQVIAAHRGPDYRVFAIGFQPGFPYAGYLAPELSGLPRRDSPRARVPAGSVAIVGRQTAVYPGESPGGWHLIGRTPLEIVNVESGFFPIKVGDSLRFVPIDANAFESSRARLR